MIKRIYLVNHRKNAPADFTRSAGAENQSYYAEWKNFLTSYDNQTIHYDSVVNPTTYCDGLLFRWKNGRWLKTVTKNGNDINMQYDINGLRTQKGNTYYYYDNDNNLIAMVKGNNTLHICYDSRNSPIAFTRGICYHFCCLVCR